MQRQSWSVTDFSGPFGVSVADPGAADDDGKSGSFSTTIADNSCCGAVLIGTVR